MARVASKKRMFRKWVRSQESYMLEKIVSTTTRAPDSDAIRKMAENELRRRRLYKDWEQVKP